MEIGKFISNYWTQIIFIVGLAIGFIKLEIAYREGTKCSLRNDILQIYNQYREKKEIPLYDFEAISFSYGVPCPSQRLYLKGVPKIGTPFFIGLILSCGGRSLHSCGLRSGGADREKSGQAQKS